MVSMAKPVNSQLSLGGGHTNVCLACEARGVHHHCHDYPDHGDRCHHGHDVVDRGVAE